jgi:hypothetical protein
MAQPLPQGISDELRAIIAANVLRYSSHREQFGKRIDDIFTGDPTADLQGQALPRVLIDDRQPFQRTAARRAIEHEVQSPHVVWRCRGLAVTTILARAKATPFSLFYRHFQPFPLPKTKDTRQSGTPSFLPKESTNSPIPEAWARPRQLKHPLHQRPFVLARLRLESLTATRLTNKFARPSLGDIELLSKHDDRRSLPGRAYQFPSARCLSI